MSSLIAFVSDNAIIADPKEREESIRTKVPELLQADEKILWAFKDRGGKGRDSSNLTTKRLLIKDKRGMTGKKTDYISIPYSAIRAYSVETAGRMDSDAELKIYASGYGKIAIDFVADVDVFSIYRFLNSVVLVGSAIGSDVPSGAVPTSADAFVTSSGKTSFFDLIGNNASQIDAATVESQLKAPDVSILLPDESVEMAFKCGRDSFILTTKRILRIDVQGMSGKSVEYYTLLWKSVRAFSIETAGSFLDRDTELLLYTNVPDAESSAPGLPRKNRTRFSIDFRKGGADLFAVQRFFSDKLLGPDPAPPSTHAISNAGVADTGSGSPFAWLGNDSRMIDAEECDRKYHSSPAILQSNEHVEMAFKGRRDIMLYTTKRVVFIDLQGWSGHKVEYMSLPWSSVQLFGVRSAGSVDKDSEVMLWPDFDDCFFPPKPDEDSPPPPPIPRKSFIECDFQKDKVDILAVHRYLSERCLRTEDGHVGKDGIFVPNHMSSDERVSIDIMTPSPPGTLSKFMGFVGNDASAIDPNQLDATMHGSAPILQIDEKVQMAYKAGRDTFIVTNKRIFLIDTQGFSGKRVAYISVPFTSIRAFAVESAGSWDTDAEVKVWTKTYWKAEGGIGNKLEQDLRKGKADIIQLQNYLAAQIIGSTDGATSLEGGGVTAAQAGSIDTFLSYINNDGVVQDPKGVENQLRTSPPILQPDESVDACYKMGRDMCIFTTKRVLLIDRQGMSGKRIEYRSFPLRYIRCFVVSTAGSFMSAAEATIYSDGSKHLSQDLSKCSSDIWQVQTILANKVLK